MRIASLCDAKPHQSGFLILAAFVLIHGDLTLNILLAESNYFFVLFVLGIFVLFILGIFVLRFLFTFLVQCAHDKLAVRAILGIREFVSHRDNLSTLPDPSRQEIVP